MTDVLHFPRNPRTFHAVKAQVRFSCERRGLCDEATERCINRAASLMRAKNLSAREAINEGIALAKRLASFSDRGHGPMGGAA